jgi:hypothetical protein
VILASGENPDPANRGVEPARSKDQSDTRHFDAISLK